jgi:hypothetical protein
MTGYMGSTLSKRWTWMLLMIAALGLLFVHLLQYNWTLHARMNLLFRGYVLCHLQSPSQMKPPSEPLPPMFVSKLVYANGVCVGYLDRYGYFLPISNAGNRDQLNAKTTTDVVILFCLERILIATCIAICLDLLWRFYKERSVGNQPRGFGPTPPLRRD